MGFGAVLPKKASQAEMEAGTETALRSMTPELIAIAAAAHGGGGGGGPAAHIGIVNSRYYTPHGANFSGTFAMAAGRKYAAPIYLPAAVTFERIGIEVTTASGAGTLIRLGIYANGTGAPGALELDAGTVTADSNAVKEITISQALDAGWHWLACISDSTPTCRADAADTAQRQPQYGGSGTTGAPANLYRDVAFGALSDPFGAVTYTTTGNMPLLWLRDV